MMPPDVECDCGHVHGVRGLRGAAAVLEGSPADPPCRPGGQVVHLTHGSTAGSASARMQHTARHRLLALALAGLWCALPVAGAVHDGEHAHRYCAEHGAVEEAGPRAEREGQQPSGTAGLGLEGADAPSEATAHAACAFSFAHRLGDGARPGPPPGKVLSPPPPRIPAELPPGAGYTPRPLSRAPKASPPVA